ALKARRRAATSRPTAPSATRPTVRPPSSRPVNRLYISRKSPARSKAGPPPRNVSATWGRCRASMSMNASVMSAPASAFRPGVGNRPGGGDRGPPLRRGERGVVFPGAARAAADQGGGAPLDPRGVSKPAPDDGAAPPRLGEALRELAAVEVDRLGDPPVLVR